MVYFLLFSAWLFASEPDDFSHRTQDPEIGNFLDESMNAGLDKAAAATSDCKKQSLHNEIISRLGGFKLSVVETFPYNVKLNEDNGTAIQIKNGKTRDSIYRDSNKLPGLKYGPMEAGGCCAPTFKYKGFHLAADKLGHFLHSGYEMYYAADLKNNQEFVDASKTTSFWNNVVRKLAERKFQTKATGEKAVLEMSRFQETSVWGLISTGVYSYGDIVANLEGYYFWKQLTDGPNPYFSCVEGKWKKVRDFSWGDYVNEGWDEALNCSEFYSEDMKNEVKALVKEALFKQGIKASACPVDTEKCRKIVAKYSGDLAGAVSPACALAAKGSGDAKSDGTKEKDAL